MHRRVVAQTVAALPHRASQRPWDLEVETAPQNTASSLGLHVASNSRQQPTLDGNRNVDSNNFTNGRILSFLMNSSDDSIASGGDHLGLSSSPVSIHHDSPTSSIPREDMVDTPPPLQPENNEQLDDDFDESDGIEWELQNNGLYVGVFFVL